MRWKHRPEGDRFAIEQSPQRAAWRRRDPEEIAPVAACLASNTSSSATGAVFGIDGGTFMS